MCTAENYKILIKEIKQRTNNWKDTHVHVSENLMLLRCLYYPKPSTDSMLSPLKFQWHF